jgi:hypothetical protein
MAKNEMFLIPIDHTNFLDGVIDDRLLFDIINGRQNKVLNFDFSEAEEVYSQLSKKMQERYKEIAEK